MQIQKGLVKYKDRTDIVCTYGLTDEGRQYYFLDNTSMSNGNIIASTVLVEAIDPVAVASSVTFTMALSPLKIIELTRFLY